MVGKIFVYYLFWHSPWVLQGINNKDDIGSVNNIKIQ